MVAIFCGTYDGNGSSTVKNTSSLGWRPTRVIIKDVTNDNDGYDRAFTNVNAGGVVANSVRTGRPCFWGIYL